MVFVRLFFQDALHEYYEERRKHGVKAVGQRQSFYLLRFHRNENERAEKAQKDFDKAAMTTQQDQAFQRNSLAA